MIINQQDQNIMEVFQRVCEQLSQEMISKINKERLNEGKSVLTNEQIQSLITEVSNTSIRMERLYEMTTVYDDAYIRRTVQDNMDKNENIIDIIKRFIELI